MNMQVGSAVVSQISTPTATWSCLIMLLSVHLAMNHAAVRAVSLHSLNRQRANLVLSNWLDEKVMLTPQQVSHQERIFEWDVVLRWRDSAPFARMKIDSLRSLLQTLSPSHNLTGAIPDSELILQSLIKMYSCEDFLLWYDARQKKAVIVLKEKASSQAQLRAWALGLWVAHRVEQQYATGAGSAQIFQLLETTLTELSVQWEDSIERMKVAGWDVDIANLETFGHTRICLKQDSDILQRTGTERLWHSA